MAINIKKIILEELSRLAEGDIVRPNFGGAEPPDMSPSLFLSTLQEIEEILIDVVEDDDLDEAQNDTLNALLDHVQDMMKDEDADDMGSDDDDDDDDDDVTGSERSELDRFTSWMKKRD